LATSSRERNLKLHHVLSLESFGTLGNLKLDLVAFVQRLKSTGLNSGMVYENIIPGSALDKTIALLVVKPFYCSLFFHFSSF